MNEILTSDGGSVRAHCEGEVAVPWQTAMRRAIRDSAELCRRLELPPEFGSDAAEKGFSVFVPLEWLARIRPRDPEDPLLKQVLASPAETLQVNGFAADPLDEASTNPQPGLLHKYRGRALLVTTGACAIHCRYCFRRHFPYDSVPKGEEAWQPTIEAIASDTSIEEVLLSGGDPLTLVDRSLRRLVEQLAAIPHLRRIRVHTRLPIVLPQRITNELIELFQSTRLTVWFVVHCNHAAELDAATLRALGRLVDAGIPVLNQAVLMRGINDSVKALKDLCLRLVDHRVQPYYLHQLDRVAGAAHFEVAETTGLRLIEMLRAELPGYAMPQYVREVPGERSKTPITVPIGETPTPYQEH